MLITKAINKNESVAHYELKQIAKYILYSKGFTCIATEVGMERYDSLLSEYKWFKSTHKIIIDTIGIKGNLESVRNYGKSLDKYKLMGIEAKASYGDFLNGFCCQSEYTYVIAPKGVIPVDKIPNKIGLIEVDLESYQILRTSKGFEFYGIETVKQCSSRKKEIYRGRNDLFRKDMFNYLRKIAYRSSVNDIFKKNEILIKGFKIRKEQ
ncbi:MAG: hypothetical protein K0Q47_21 [Sedimentibacter sp.]|jgi:hypothetical protein|nr:hypothetical protein [Sedimentibacter sp.]